MNILFYSLLIFGFSYLILKLIANVSSKKLSRFERTTNKLEQICIDNKIDYLTMTLANDSLVTRARNTLASVFLAYKECTHLMFIDADIPS